MIFKSHASAEKQTFDSRLPDRSARRSTVFSRQLMVFIVKQQDATWWMFSLYFQITGDTLVLKNTTFLFVFFSQSY